ncbi:hypothetical protein D9M71_408560 [compost metagenome]
MGNGLVARYANASGEAATRLGQVNQVIVVHGVHIGPLGQDFAEVLTGNPGAREDAHQLLPVPLVDSLAQVVEVVAEYIEDAQHRLAVGEEDVVPHHRIAAGDPREVAEAAGGITEDFQIFTALGQRIDQREGQQVRQVAGGGQHLVVMLDLHVLDVRAEFAPKAADQGHGLGVGVFQRSEDHLVAAIEVRPGRLHPALLGAGDGMPRHETRRHATEGDPRGAHHVALGAADIGEHGIAEVVAGEFGQHPLHGQDRHRQLDHVGAAAGCLQRLLAAIHHAQLHGHAARFRVAIDADHFLEHALLAQPLGEGAADQAEPHHHQAAQFLRRRLSHGQAPWPGLPDSGRFLPAGRWRCAGAAACRSRPPGAGSRLRRAGPDIPGRRRA